MAFNFTTFPVLETERLTLRALELNDAKAIFGLRTNKEVNTFITRTMLNNLSETRALIDSISNSIANNTRIFWVLESKDTAELLGTIGLKISKLRRIMQKLDMTCIQIFKRMVI